MREGGRERKEGRERREEEQREGGRKEGERRKGKQTNDRVGVDGGDEQLVFQSNMAHPLYYVGGCGMFVLGLCKGKGMA